MLEFLPAKTLKKKFGVFGHFYSVNLSPGEQINCRSVLEIVKKKRSTLQYKFIIGKAGGCHFYHDESRVIPPPGRGE